MIADSSRQGRVSTGSQHADQIITTRTSSDDNCEKSQENLVTFNTDHTYRKMTKSFESTAAKAKADGFPELSKEEKLTTPLKLGENFFAKIWKGNAIVETDKNEKVDCGTFP